MEAVAETGKRVKALENRPTLLPGLGLYIRAYNELSYDRQTGMSVGPIPWSSVIKWCELNTIYDIDDIGTCLRYIRKLEEHESEMREKVKPE